MDVHHGEPRVGAEGVRPHREDRAVRGPQPGHLQTGIIRPTGSRVLVERVREQTGCAGLELSSSESNDCVIQRVRVGKYQ